MKHLLFIFSIFALLITAGCVIQNNNPPIPPTPQIVYVTVLVTPTQTAYQPFTSRTVYHTVTPASFQTGDPDVVVVVTIESRLGELQVFRTHIDEKAALGIDTSAAEVKYNEARQKIDSVRSMPSSQVTQALAVLNAAAVTINQGESALDKAWAETEVAAAQSTINNVNTIIAWFKGNSRTVNDQQLPSIIAKRDLAVSYISNANVNIAQGNFVQARSMAQDAFTKGNESYTDALARQRQLVS